MCNHEQIDCPNHEGGYDCTPFCRVCEGNQGYCPICEPLTIDTVLHIIKTMKDSGDFHNPTLDELEQRLQ